MKTPFGFIPHRLVIQGLPALNNLPYNVLFMSFKVEDGKRISGSAVYNPDFSSFTSSVGVMGMKYLNKYNSAWYLKIIYDNENGYIGTKYHNDALIGSADGKEWKMFFIHLTLLGLSNGETCEFDYGVAERD